MCLEDKISPKYAKSELKHIPFFETNMIKLYALFQTKPAQKPYPLGLHIQSYKALCLYEGVPHPHGQYPWPLNREHHSRSKITAQ